MEEAMVRTAPSAPGVLQDLCGVQAAAAPGTNRRAFVHSRFTRIEVQANVMSNVLDDGREERHRRCHLGQVVHLGVRS